MRRLGEILLDKGSIDVSELHSALEACHRKGGRLGTQLLRLGFVEERALLNALSEQLGVPFIPEKLLLQAPRAALEAVPARILRKLDAVPFEKTQWKLLVAMANPRDSAALEELVTLTKLKVEAYVATEAAINRALEQIGEEKTPLMREKEAPAKPAPLLSDWESLWQPPQLPADKLQHITRSRRLRREPLFATFPGLAPVIDVPGMTLEDTLDNDLYLRRLQDARSRAEIGDMLLRYAELYLGRVCLFALHRDNVIGWLARGQGVVLDDVLSFSTPLDTSSLFLGLHDSLRHFLGRIPEGEEQQQLTRVMGDPPPLDVFAVPIIVQNRCIAFLVGDNPGEPGGGIPTQELVGGTTAASMAFEILLLKGRMRNGLTGAAQ